jgi:hypothetical protein
MRAMTTSWVAPDACTLPMVEQPMRVAEFDTLFSTDVVAVERISSTRLRMILEGQTDLATRTRDLAERETACCSFFTFDVSELAGSSADVVRLQLDIGVPQARADVLDALAQRATNLSSADAS